MQRTVDAVTCSVKLSSFVICLFNLKPLMEISVTVYWCRVIFFRINVLLYYFEVGHSLVLLFTDDGIDTRIHSIKIKSSKGKELGLNKDFFTSENLVRFPKLECFDPEILYRRSILLQRYSFFWKIFFFKFWKVYLMIITYKIILHLIEISFVHKKYFFVVDLWHY